MKVLISKSARHIRVNACHNIYIYIDVLVVVFMIFQALVPDLGYFSAGLIVSAIYFYLQKIFLVLCLVTSIQIKSVGILWLGGDFPCTLPGFFSP